MSAQTHRFNFRIRRETQAIAERKQQLIAIFANDQAASLVVNAVTASFEWLRCFAYQIALLN
jgi:hypothetical protein